MTANRLSSRASWFLFAEMTKLRRSDRPPDAQLRAWKRLAGKLAEFVPPDLPPLPPFEIV